MSIMTPIEVRIARGMVRPGSRNSSPISATVK
jgi:hypothetical protein